MGAKVKAIPILNKRLKEKGWTQKRLSEESGVSTGAISRFDKNASHVADHVFSIARALGLRAEDLFELKVVEDEDS